MSRQHIATYRRKLAEQHRLTGSLNERVLSAAFADLLERTGRAHDLVFTNQWEGRVPRGNPIAVDGALVPAILRKPFGFWEAKDSKDDLDREIKAKLATGYPDDNIIYEDTRTAVLRQDGREVLRADMADDAQLLDLFYAYERPELTEFKAASAKFRADLPQVLDALGHVIDEAQALERLRHQPRRVPGARQTGDQSQRYRRRRAVDADPAHPDLVARIRTIVDENRKPNRLSEKNTVALPSVLGMILGKVRFNMAELPHPIPYQGSKRSLAHVIGVYVPNDVDTWYEPFAGSAAMSLWMATRAVSDQSAS